MVMELFSFFSFPVFRCFDGSHFLVFLQLFLGAPAGQNNITQVFCHFPRWPPFWKPNAPSMFVQSRCLVLVMYQSKTDFTANETHFFSLPLRSARSPTPLSLLWGLGGSRRLNHRISVVPQRFIAELVMHFPPVIIYKTALYCATQRPPR